jgi:hypothetical protein
MNSNIESVRCVNGDVYVFGHNCILKNNVSGTEFNLNNKEPILLASNIVSVSQTGGFLFLSNNNSNIIYTYKFLDKKEESLLSNLTDIGIITIWATASIVFLLSLTIPKK